MTRLRHRSVLALLLVASACGGPSRQPSLSPAPLLELRLAYPEPGEGRERHTLDGEVLYLAPEPIASDPDLIVVRSDVAPIGDGRSRVTLDLRCTFEAQDRMLRASREHMQQRNRHSIQPRSQVRARGDRGGRVRGSANGLGRIGERSGADGTADPGAMAGLRHGVEAAPG